MGLKVKAQGCIIVGTRLNVVCDLNREQLLYEVDSDEALRAASTDKFLFHCATVGRLCCPESQVGRLHILCD